jgi:2-hydroxy-6-oxonona-2,4-dienedioate hydrolase
LAGEPGGEPPSLGEAAVAWSRHHHISVNGRKVRHREAGSGPCIILVHGLGVSADYWIRNGPPIATCGFRVIAPDLPGFGLTEGPKRGLTVVEQAEAIRDWAEAAGVEEAVYVGHSLSCQSVLELAAERPERVRGLALAAPTGEGRPRRRLIRQALGLARDVVHESPLLAALVAQAYLRAGPAKVVRTWWMGARHDPRLVLPHVHAPIIVILGEKDPVVDLDFAVQLASGVADGRVVIVPRLAHGVIFDRTGMFNSALVEFSRRCFGCA